MPNQAKKDVFNKTYIFVIYLVTIFTQAEKTKKDFHFYSFAVEGKLLIGSVLTKRGTELEESTRAVVNYFAVTC